MVNNSGEASAVLAFDREPKKRTRAKRLGATDQACLKGPTQRASRFQYLLGRCFDLLAVRGSRIADSIHRKGLLGGIIMVNTWLIYG